MKRAIFIFRNDLRTHDNTALMQAKVDGYKIVPIYILKKTDNKNALNFLKNVLASMTHITVYEEEDDIKVLEQLQCEAIYFNEEYDIHSIKRDNRIKAFCKKRNILCITTEDYGLLPLKEGLVDDERPYHVFSQFYKKVLSLDVRKPEKEIELKEILPLKNYESERNYPALGRTTRLSASLQFGLLSVREFYWAVIKKFGKDHGLNRELIFREFYLKIYALNPKLQQGISFRGKEIVWNCDRSLFNKWKKGRTGFPLVDAGMRELSETGFQHNRLRMLCGSVLTKYFLIDWRWGMKYYENILTDANIFSNTAGWGFVSSTGVDAVPYFRYPFNPFIQSKKFDSHAVYIKRWVPELQEVEAKDIHKWYDADVRAKYNAAYPEPVIDYEMASKRAVDTFRKTYKNT
jgi:deoxyribodipyrimidine photo-lyase